MTSMLNPNLWGTTIHLPLGEVERSHLGVQLGQIIQVDVCWSKMVIAFTWQQNNATRKDFQNTESAT